jgi:peptidoglycan biosynthesis protein MviN/MurJ (putative lipid II flippase)
LKTLAHKLGTLHPDHRRIARGAFRVALFLVLGKVAGAAKEMAVAYRYGVSDTVDAYQFTMTMATWLPATIVGVLSVVLIPVLIRLSRGNARDRSRFVREVQGTTVLCAVLLALATWACWPLVLHTLGSALPPNVAGMTQLLVIAFAPVGAFMLIAGVAAARLRSHERHVNSLLDSAPAVSILAWVLFSSRPGAEPLFWGVLMGYGVQALWLAWLASRAEGGFWGRPVFTLHSAEWRGVFNAMGVMLIGQVAMSFVGPLDQYAAANLGDNANATLGYANRLLSLLLGVGAVSVGRAALPVLADVQGSGDASRARAMALKWSVLMVAAGAAAAMLGWLLAPWGVRVLFERGAFSPVDTLAVTHVLRWGLPQVPFFFGVLVLVQLLASQNRYRIMSVIAVANFALKALLNHVLAPSMGIGGVMLATSIMYALSYACYGLVSLRTVSAVAPPDAGTRP